MAAKDLLDPKKLYQMSMDGQKINVKFCEEIVESPKKAAIHTLIDIGSCSVHVVHGSLKTGIGKSSWKIKETMKGAFCVLHDTSARREDYTTVTKSTAFLLYFCAARSHWYYLM